MTTLPSQSSAPIENVNRGTLFALLAVPLGVIAWVLLQQLGFVFIYAALGYGIAWATLFFYLKGAGGPITRVGAVRVTIVTLLALGVSVFAGLASTALLNFTRFRHVSLVEAMSSPEFGDFFGDYLANSVELYILPILIGVVVGIFSLFGLLRRAFQSAAPPVDPAAPPAPTPL